MSDKDNNSQQGNNSSQGKPPSYGTQVVMKGEDGKNTTVITK
jgi:hypothetical protein